MAVDFDKLERLRIYQLTNKVAVCEVLVVYWDEVAPVTKVYATSCFDTIVPFRKIARHLDSSIEARIPGKKFIPYSLNADLTTESINITLVDTDKVIEGLFDTYQEGVKCELFLYYPKVDDTNDDDLFYSAWWGHLQKPEFSGRGFVQTTAENGFKSRELKLGRRIRPSLCTQTFGGLQTDINEYRGSGCVYNIHLPGGTIGNLDGGDPYTSCDHSKAACVARLGAFPNGEPKYWMGFQTDVAPVLYDGNTGATAAAKGSASRLKNPIIIVAGQKYVSNLPNLFYRKELSQNSNHPEQGFVRGIWEVSEGPNELIEEIVINDKIIETSQTHYKFGELGQGLTGYSPNISNFSGTSIVNACYGWTNAATTELESLKTRIKVKGYNKVRVYTDPDTFTEIWTNKRIPWLLELYTNNRFGRGYRHNKFHLQELIDLQEDWLDEDIIYTDPNGNTRQTIRDKFDAIIDGRPAQEVILDICRSGRISVPFQWDGKYLITPLSKCEDLEACRVFTDRGNNRNILLRDNVQTIRKSRKSILSLINKAVVTYEDSTKYDRERPLVFVDELTQQQASKALGDASFNELERRFKAFGHRHENLAFKLGWSFVQLGEFDSGGTENNLGLDFDVMVEQALGLKKFEVIKVDSDILDNEDFTYFRVMGIKKSADNIATLSVQAYPEDFYETFEVHDSSPPPPPVDFPPWFPPICNPTAGSFSYSNGYAVIPIDPC